MSKQIPEWQRQFHSRAWYESLSQFDYDNRLRAWSLLAAFGEVESVLDVGCGNGAMISTLRKVPIKPCLGIELMLDVRDVVPVNVATNILVRDFTEEAELGGQRFELVTAIDVGDYVPVASIPTFVRNLTRHGGRWVVVTLGGNPYIGDRAGTPNPEPWTTAFEGRGWAENTKVSVGLRTLWGVICHTHPTFRNFQQVLVFSPKGEIKA